MKIENYQVAMSSQNKNVKFNSTKLNVFEDEVNFASKKSANIENIGFKNEEKTTLDDEIGAKLSSAILKNISTMHSKIKNDRLEIDIIKAEAESSSFQTKAYIKADGKELEISVKANLQRSFISRTHIKFDDDWLFDPLVISLDGKMPTLSEKSFEFDIDSDGEIDQISKLGDFCAFLALDINENNKIDNGLELFGTKTGDGFADLSKFDDDKNGWIDENDPIFHKLRIWQKTDKEDKLIALGEVGIGAIFLGNAKIDFSFKTLEKNEMLGKMRKSGFFLKENAEAGIISQIDLAKKPKIIKEQEVKTKLENILKKDIESKKPNTDYAQSFIELIDKRQQEMKAEFLRATKIDEKKLNLRQATLEAQILNMIIRSI